MRNLLQYPITHEEIVDVLEEAYKMMHDRHIEEIGGLHLAIMVGLVDYVKENPDVIVKKFSWK